MSDDISSNVDRLDEILEQYRESDFTPDENPDNEKLYEEKSEKLKSKAIKESKAKLEAWAKDREAQIKMQIVADFADWLHKNGYIDSDYYTEEPKVVDRYLAQLTNFKGEK